MLVGLGNPGKNYANTPHNVGFAVIDELAARLMCRLRRGLRFSSRTARAVYEETDLLLVKPETFMNNSGAAVARLLRYRKTSPEDLVLILDDAELDLGRLRIRGGGSSGGHRGLQSVIEHTGSEDFVRLRMGIGRDRKGRDLKDHVLTPFKVDERDKVKEMVGHAADAVLCLLQSGTEVAMNTFNGRQY